MTNQRSYEVVLFDLDGTLLDTYHRILDSMRYADKTVFGGKFPDEVLLFKVGQPLDAQAKEFTDDPALQEEFVRVYRAHNEERLNEQVEAFPGIADALQALLDEGYKLGVVTSKRRGIAQNGLEHFGLFHYFSCLVGMEDSVGHKPEPDPLFKGAEELGVDIKRCIYVGDSPYDVQAALAAGIPALAVSWGKFFSAEVLKKENPTAILHTPADLPAIVNALSAFSAS